ncbi:precorrin-6Y C5,15-methyltransferase (decarboxylating) [Agrobacterium fabrum]|uniref:precorrin-6y C5,15-methyltransferase (decarboxylating) subunit CbiE n=1 Tax=Agrobacterium fabrum TaxID=1176649 RepID=UPI00088D4E1B|nr:precorrin-6y C5,15-methyltransferase (decarboxylating) subunit CbiE [Agrobacterium fabrum]MDH6296898.1 precorrin-6Y C5,15-methyltransferase (decarboxylating) [Agrobacterium fabrum]SDB67030.1 precorrin-6Y C5,15-methyltransferase (decarboxylating) [Agrobacterium fabrum]SER46914.1 precorrin-6Y C5,15-methyltransferase (decarboxylating) [Agrobacterium fabrum]
MTSEYSGTAKASTEKNEKPWLSIVGIGEDGLQGLGENARLAIEAAEVVFGGKRHLELAAGAIRGEARAWPVPFDVDMNDVLALRGRRVCVLASGDPFFYGVGVTLLRRIPAEETACYPSPSAFSLAASRLGWALQSAECVSLHGRSIDLLRPHLHHGARIIALTSDERDPALVARLLSDAGFGRSEFILLEALGGDQEKRRQTQAADFSFEDVNPLNVVAIEVVADEGARVLPFAHGLDDGLFEHDGQITKREIRAVTLSSLAPRRGELLWDIGAGSGSIGIEWMLTHPSLRAIAVEQHPERAERIARNADAFGVPGLEVMIGTAPAAFEGLSSPDAIFIGGGGSETGVLETAMDALKPSGRLVANAVTLEMEAVLLAAQAKFGGSMIRLEVSRAAAVGSMSGWRPAMPVTQWSWVKPW